MKNAPSFFCHFIILHWFKWLQIVLAKQYAFSVRKCHNPQKQEWQRSFLFYFPVLSVSMNERKLTSCNSLCFLGKTWQYLCKVCHFGIKVLFSVFRTTKECHIEHFYSNLNFNLTWCCCRRCKVSFVLFNIALSYDSNRLIQLQSGYCEMK